MAWDIHLSCHAPAMHAQGKRHQQNLAKRAAREAAEKPMAPAPQKRAVVKKTGIARLLSWRVLKILGTPCLGSMSVSY